MRDNSAVICAAGLASLLPLIVFSNAFHQLYYFHDDWELLDGATRSSLLEWTFQPFLGESIIPLFKLLWLGAVRLFDGSYFAMIWLLWATHVVNALLFGWLLARFGVPAAAVAFSVLTFGLAWSNIETLGWSMQWSSQLALVFFLAAWHLLLRILEGGHGVAGYALCLFASAVTSSRGILSALVLSLFVLLVTMDRKQKILLLAVSMTPSLLMALVMYLVVFRNNGDRNLLAAISYGSHYFSLNPLFHLLPIPKKTVDIPEILICGSIKTAVIAWALWNSNLRWRPLLMTLVAFDLVTAAALGFARSDIGLDTTVSSRYQYISLLCFGPMAGMLFVRPRMRTQATVFLVWVLMLAYPWKRHAPRWAGWRGVEIRERVATTPDDGHFDPSSVAASRAREMERLYHLR